MPAEPPPGPAIYDLPPPPPPAVYSKDIVIDADTMPELTVVPDGYTPYQPSLINTTNNTRPISELKNVKSDAHRNETLLNQRMSTKYLQKPATAFSRPIFGPSPQPVGDLIGDVGATEVVSHDKGNEGTVNSSSIHIQESPSPSLFHRSA